MAYLRKERFSAGTYNKSKLKNIGRCNILREFYSNAYELELPSNIGIYPIFNIIDLYPFKETKSVTTNEPISNEYYTIGWKKRLPKTVHKEIETMLDQRVAKRTRGK